MKLPDKNEFVMHEGHADMLLRQYQMHNENIAAQLTIALSNTRYFVSHAADRFIYSEVIKQYKQYLNKLNKGEI